MSIPVSTRFNSIKGKEAWRQNLQLASLVLDRVRTSLGPRGAYKMVIYNRGPEQVVKISKDIIPVLEELGIQYPSITILAEAAKMQREEAGDGVNQFIILLTSLLKRADELVSMGVHPNTIIKGYLEATKKALEVIESQATKVGEESFEGIIECVDCGRGLLTPDIRKMIIDASKIAITDGKLDKDRIRIVKKPSGRVDESKLIKGIILKKEKIHPIMPDVVENPRIAVLSGSLGIKRLEVKMKGQGPLPIRLNIKDPAQIAMYRETENELKKASVSRVKSVGANVLICEHLIDDRLKGELAMQGIFALDKVDKEDTKAISEATGAQIVGDVNDLSEMDLGSAERLEAGKLEPEKIATITGCRGATFMLRGNTSQALDEMEKLLKNSMAVLKIAVEDGRALPGGGATEMHIAEELRKFSLEFPGREQIAIRYFADALEEIPRCLAENNGLDALDIMAQLSKYHAGGLCCYGVDRRGCSDTVSIELAKVKISAIRRAHEVASMMLRIDELLTSKEMLKFHKK